MEERKQQREEQAFHIADMNSVIFIPVALIETVLEEAAASRIEEPILLKSQRYVPVSE